MRTIARSTGPSARCLEVRILCRFATTMSNRAHTGSSAINGLYMTRPGEIEVDAWKDMLGDMDGAENWSWKSFYAAMKKSETFAAPGDGVAKKADISWNALDHGTDGPIHASYPNLYVPALAALTELIVVQHVSRGGQLDEGNGRNRHSRKREHVQRRDLGRGGLDLEHQPQERDPVLQSQRVSRPATGPGQL